MTNVSRFKRSWLRKGLIIAAIIGVTGGGYGFYLFNMPHRDVVATKADGEIDAQALVDEFLKDGTAANAKYLDTEGESKVLAVSGTVSSKETDLKGQTVVLLKAEGAEAGVRCSFTAETNTQADGLKTEDIVTIKGVIRAGASFDADLDLYEHAVLEKCSLVP
ncbi:MAG: hypothetical protein IPJ76_07350 [Flavobacteriales bacterium]|nr:MAG: hypothetical protein IPJ76_07350 [Flavobacteriales bacterium]